MRLLKICVLGSTFSLGKSSVWCGRIFGIVWVTLLEKLFLAYSCSSDEQQLPLSLWFEHLLIFQRARVALVAAQLAYWFWPKEHRFSSWGKKHSQPNHSERDVTARSSRRSPPSYCVSPLKRVEVIFSRKEQSPLLLSFLASFFRCTLRWWQLVEKARNWTQNLWWQSFLPSSKPISPKNPQQVWEWRAIVFCFG